MPRLLAAAAALLLASSPHAQEGAAQGALACGPDEAPPPESLALDRIIPAVYRIVSGAAGTARPWDALRRLHAPGARLTVTRHAADGRLTAEPGDLETFIALNERLFAGRGFHEREVARRVERFGHLAHVWSTYESRTRPDTAPYARGINSFQLLHDGRRWCILSVAWDTEVPAHPIPPRYAPAARGR